MARNKIDIDLKRLKALASQGLSEEQIAASLGISTDTIGRRKQDDADFAEALKSGKASGIETVTNALFEKANTGDNTAMIFWLKNRAGWRDKHEQEVSGPGGGAQEHKWTVEFVGGDDD